MTVYSALDPVAVGLRNVLNVAGLTALATGGIWDDVPIGPTFPLVVFDLSERPIGGFGTKPGTGAFYELDVRFHIYTDDATVTGWYQAHVILAKIVELMETTTLSASGFTIRAKFTDNTEQFPNEIIAGRKVKELAQNGRIYADLS